MFCIAADPVDYRVQRWIDAMPQYGPGHADLVAELRAGLPPTLAVAGGYLDGIGVPACVAICHQGGRETGDLRRGTIEPMAKLDYDKLNSMTRYMMISVFAVQPEALDRDRSAVIDETATLPQAAGGQRGRGPRVVRRRRASAADADFMIWTHAERVEDLQATYSAFRRTTLGPGQRPGVERGRAAPARGVQQEPRAGLHRR